MKTIYKLTLTAREHVTDRIVHSQSHLVSTEEMARALLENWGEAMRLPGTKIDDSSLDCDFISFSGPRVYGTIEITKSHIFEPTDHLVKVPNNNWVNFQFFHTKEAADYYYNRILKQPQL